MEYWIYRQLPGEAEPVLIDIAEGTSYLDESLPVGGTATYMVRSAHIRDALNSGYSNAVTGTAKMGKPLPACYEGLVSDGPALIWEPVEGAVTYKVLRATKKTDTLKYYTEICADANGEDGFVDETAQKGKTYYYKVVAVSASGVTTYSSYLKVTYKK